MKIILVLWFPAAFCLYSMQDGVDWVLIILGTRIIKKKRPVRPVFPDYLSVSYKYAFIEKTLLSFIAQLSLFLRQTWNSHLGLYCYSYYFLFLTNQTASIILKAYCVFKVRTFQTYYLLYVSLSKMKTFLFSHLHVFKINMEYPTKNAWKSSEILENNHWASSFKVVS